MAVTALFGVGVMGEAILAGLLGAGRPPAEVIVVARRPERAADLQQRYGVRAMPAAEAAAAAQTLLLAAKPQDMAALLAEISPSVTSEKLVISLAAGLPTEFLERRLPANVPVIRVMPNTPALVGAGMSVMSGGRHCTAAHEREAAALLAGVGQVLQVPESQQDAVTAVSGSGPAYIFYIVEAMIEAGVLMGLPRATATTLTVQTLTGAAAMLQETGEHPSMLREKVTSPGGTTVAALRRLDDHKVRAAFLSAMESARDRSRALAEDLDRNADGAVGGRSDGPSPAS